MPSTQTAHICDNAAQSEGVPLDVMRAIARVETGRTADGALQPWPWTINVEGKGIWFTSEFEAKSYVFEIFKAGKRSFDIGCFQINYRWHGEAFRSIDAMFDPDENAKYAARFLKDLYTEFPPQKRGRCSSDCKPAAFFARWGADRRDGLCHRRFQKSAGRYADHDAIERC
nr:transglycosylase SLT domain-containing protein [Ruegeria sp. AU67]